MIKIFYNIKKKLKLFLKKSKNLRFQNEIRYETYYGHIPLLGNYRVFRMILLSDVDTCMLERSLCYLYR